jgi:hypothetical protein
VDTLGLGTYDDVPSNTRETMEPAPSRLPSGSGPVPREPDFISGYSDSSKLLPRRANLPGEADRPPTSRRPADDTLAEGLPTSGASKLPSDEKNPSARSDYYDRMQTGVESGPWAESDTGAYADDSQAESGLPSTPSADSSLDNFLGALGNAWSGYVVEDQSDQPGFPVPQREASMKSAPRVATALELVGELAKDFLKEFGKKDLTRRHVMAFLQDRGLNMFLASDVIRCLKHRHKVVISDVLDAFPKARTASAGWTTLASAWQTMLDVSTDPSTDEEVAYVMAACASDTALTLAELERHKV